MTRAIALDSSVPKASAAMPNRGLASLGKNVFSVRKLPVLACSAGTAR